MRIYTVVIEVVVVVVAGSMYRWYICVFFLLNFKVIFLLLLSLSLSK